MNDSLRIHELQESFRPGVDDLADEAWAELRAPLAGDPELQRRAESIQRHDQAVRSAMHEVRIPVGLAERLLASLSLSQDEALSAAPASPHGETVSLPSPALQVSRLSRRAGATALIGTLSLAILALVIGLWPGGPSDRGEGSEEELAGMIDDWENDPALTGSDHWHKLAAGQPLSTHPFQQGDLLAAANRSIGPARRAGLSLVVYELAGGGNGPTARLYVAYTGRKYPVLSAPQSLVRGLTGFRGAMAWQRDDYLYVVVVDTREARPEQFVRLPEYL